MPKLGLGLLLGMGVIQQLTVLPPAWVSLPLAVVALSLLRLSSTPNPTPVPALPHLPTNQRPACDRTTDTGV